ncbi:MAG: 5-(carboxyamino)imidazole ribonucleotide synthase [Cyclobacteriaceae bacterium]
MDITQSKLGILGGGQLGKMLLQSALDFNLTLKILDPDANAPCSKIAHEFVEGSLTDFDTVVAFGEDCDVITIEIENVNTDALKELKSQGKKVYPEPEIIELIQDKRKQKTFYKVNRIPTAEFILTQNLEEVKSQKEYLPAVNKLGKGGYDGRGVQVIREEEDLDKGFDEPGLLEKLIDFEKELSVIVARSSNGEIATFPVVELVFHPEANLVEYLFAPADITEQQAKDSQEIARMVIERLDMTGILAVEMFLTKDGQILVNEVAPRPHNSGHQTIEANHCSQYEQHLRAIFGLPLGDTEALAPSSMVNLLGEEGFQGDAIYEGMEEVLKIGGTHIHLYGKKTTRSYRKMGHITIVDSDKESLIEKTKKVKSLLKIKA